METNFALHDVINAIRCAVIIVSGLTNTTGVDEVASAEADVDRLWIIAFNQASVLFKNNGNMGMPMKTDLCILITEVRFGFNRIEYIAPTFGHVKGAMHECHALMEGVQRKIS